MILILCLTSYDLRRTDVKYEIIEQLGKGIVYKAFDPLLAREVAIKVLAAQFFEQPEIKHDFTAKQPRWLNSYENITILHHPVEIEGQPYIVKVLDLSFREGLTFFEAGDLKGAKLKINRVGKAAADYLEAAEYLKK